MTLASSTTHLLTKRSRWAFLCIREFYRRNHPHQDSLLQIYESLTERHSAIIKTIPVDSIVPYLEVVQTVADRRLQSYKDAHPADEDDDDDDDDPNAEPEGSKGHKKPSSKKGKKGESQDDEDSALAKALAKALAPFGESLNTLKGQIEELKQGKTADSRKARLEALVKDTGKFGERAIKAFNRMSFKTDEDFEDYLDEVEEDLEAENQERLNKGLEALGKPVGAQPGKNAGKKTGEEEVMSDDEVKELAKG